MDLSIIIVNWNTCNILHDCLTSIRNSRGGIEIEVFVVDNDSSDGSREMVQKDFPEVHLINSGGNIGFGRANNLAIPLATAPYILFLNPDTIVNHKALDKMCAFLNNNPRTGVISCKIMDQTGCVAELPLQMEKTPFKRFLLQIFDARESANIIKRIFPSQSPHKSGYVRNFYGPCLLIRKEVLDEVGYFDEQFFMYAEDIDLCERIHKKGWQLYYMSEVDIIHLGEQSSDHAPKDFSMLMMCESISKLMSKNYGARGASIYKLGVFVSSVLRLIILLFLVGIDYVTGRKKKVKYKQSWHKHMIMLKWSLMLRMFKEIESHG
ncbi:MAG: glycosyltransferase family 2 protein [Smithella sp.]